MKDDPLFNAVLDTLLEYMAFFELCDDEVLDPDIAVQQLEGAASRLGGLSEDHRRQLAELIRSRASAFPDQLMRDFVEGTPDDLGLEDHDV